MATTPHKPIMLLFMYNRTKQKEFTQKAQLTILAQLRLYFEVFEDPTSWRRAARGLKQVKGETSPGWMLMI